VLNRWISRVPPELREVQQLVNQIKRITNEKQNQRFTQPPIFRS
jgi:hypothetical protein